MKVRPLRDYVVVRPVAEPAYTGKLVCVTGHPQPSVHAEIIACGPEVRDACVGQRVIISRLQGTQIELGEPLLLLREQAILAYNE